MPTIRDVAKESGVSPATVSNVLNNSDAVHPKTRDRVLHVMQRLRYHPNAIARGLSRKRMDTIGVVLTEGFRSPLTSPYFTAVIDGILEAAAGVHQSILFSPSQTRTDVTYSVTAHREGRCDGLLIFAQPDGSTVIETLLEVGTPFVLISDACEDARISSVDVDNTAACAEMVEFLLRQGHRRIAFLTGEVTHSSAARLAGYRMALETWKVGVAPELVLTGSFGAEAVAKQVSSLMRLPAARCPTALCCYNDDLALSALSALEAMGLRVPQDISVTGFDDIPAAGPRSLTTMRQPLGEIGRRALELLLEQIHRKDMALGVTRLPVQMIVRATVAPIDS